MNFLKNIISKLVNSAIYFNQSNKIKNLLITERLKVGVYTYGVNNLFIQNYKGSEANVVIGKYCSLAPNISIITGGIHNVNWISTYPFRIKWNMSGKFEDGMPYSKGDVIIGNDVWIGTGVTILSGIKIGDGAVIAAGSMVTKNIVPYAIVGGNPAEFIRFRFSKIQIDRLLEIKWWDWNDEKVKKNVPLINSDAIEEFFESSNDE
ncbi:MAG: CatB-related O-acetyltransferase [Lutibacter sp.]